MGTRLFVDNLAPGSNEDAVRRLFAHDGRSVLTVSIMSDRQTGASHGYAFVEMGTKADAAHAIATLHGSNYRGHRLHVSEARPRVSSSPSK
jgi:RNA recognition motif-containing protein